MVDDSSQIVRALISNVEYRFVEKLSSATDGSEVVYARAPTVKGDTRLCEAGEAGYARFEARQSADDGIVTSASSSAEKLALFNLLFVTRMMCMRRATLTRKRACRLYACVRSRVGSRCAESPESSAQDCPHREFLAA